MNLQKVTKYFKDCSTSSFCLEWCWSRFTLSAMYLEPLSAWMTIEFPKLHESLQCSWSSYLKQLATYFQPERSSLVVTLQSAKAPLKSTSKSGGNQLASSNDFWSDRGSTKVKWLCFLPRWLDVRLFKGHLVVALRDATKHTFEGIIIISWKAQVVGETGLVRDTNKMQSICAMNFDTNGLMARSQRVSSQTDGNQHDRLIKFCRRRKTDDEKSSGGVYEFLAFWWATLKPSGLKKFFTVTKIKTVQKLGLSLSKILRRWCKHCFQNRNPWFDWSCVRKQLRSFSVGTALTKKVISKIS